jgi:hypothetical protein
MRLPTLLMAGLVAFGSAWAQDPAKVSPDHYKVELENEYVRVLRSTGPGHAHIPMHSHPVNIVVYLTDADVRVIGPDRVAKDSHRKRGEAIWNGEQNHERVNLSDKPYELIQVEIKERRTTSASSEKLDPVKLLPQQFSIVFENERVRVVRVKRGARAGAVMHQHPPYVAVMLTDLHAKNTNADGTTRMAQRKAGDVTFSPATQHLEANLADHPFEAVLVEIK